MPYAIKHPVKGYWQATCGFFQSPNHSTKYATAGEADTVQFFNPPRFYECETVELKEIKYAIPR